MEWIDPYPGFEYRPDEVCLSRREQVDRLHACGLEPDVFGDDADPAFFIAVAIHAGIASGITAEGNVNMLQSLVQHRPVRLDEPLTVTGRITAVTPVPRGRTIESDVIFSGRDGAPAIRARRRSLKPDADKAGMRGAGDRPPPVIEAPAGLPELSRHQLTPEGVKRYSSEGNSIHYEMEAAKRAGFRAPIIGGGMGVHYLTAALWRERIRSTGSAPAELDLDIFFRRPIFWDDAFSVRAKLGLAERSSAVRPKLGSAAVGREHGSTWDAMALVKADKVATEARINRLG